MIDFSAISAMVGALISSVSAIIVAYIQNSKRHDNAILLPPGVSVYRPQNNKVFIYVVFFTLFGGLCGYLGGIAIHARTLPQIQDLTVPNVQTPIASKVLAVLFTRDPSNMINQITSGGSLDTIESIKSIVPTSTDIYAVVVLTNVEKGMRIDGYLSSVDSAGFLCYNPVMDKRLSGIASQDYATATFASDFFWRLAPWCKGIYEFKVYLNGSFAGSSTLEVR